MQVEPRGGQSKPLSKEALDFAPSLLAIQESPPARLPRAILYSVGALFLILLTWAVFGRLDIIASAEGRLVPQTFVKIVQPADAGVVQEILVREGDTVKAGQVLLRMDTKTADADSKEIEVEHALKSLQLRRIAAELQGSPLQRQAGDPEDLYQRISAQYRDRRQSYLDAIAQQQEVLIKARNEYASAKEVLAKLEETTPILKQQAEAYTDLGSDGYVAQMMVKDKQRDYLEKARDLRAQRATVASLDAAVAAAQKQINQITSKYRSDLQNERVEADAQYQKIGQEWIKQQHKSSLLELRAPQSGVIKDLAVHTVGTVVSPGTVLLSLVPENEPLVAEVMVKNDDVGFVFAHQKVKIKIVAYPFEKYGMLDGEVLRVSADAADNGGQNTPAKDQSSDKPSQVLPYKAVIALKDQVLEAQGTRFKLVPGMQAIAEINQGSRTVMEYLLSPVRKTLHDGGRER
jgi:hemolysin D